MKIKRFLSLLMVAVLCLSSFAVFADDAEEEVIVTTEETAQDDTTEETVAMPDDGDDGKVNYSDIPTNWAYWDEGVDKPADLFFICPTVDMGGAGNLVADINNEKYRKRFVGAACQELGIYSDVSAIYAPYYRQATFPVYSLSEEEQEKYLSYAYEDVKDAFLYYYENSDATRPLIIAGFSQGADLAIRLLKDLFDEPKYQRRLVAAYCIGWRLTEEEVKEYPHLMPAQGETDLGVIIAFNSESEDITKSLIVGENEKTYAINPLNWTTTSEMADKSLNKGACFVDYSGVLTEEIPNITGAYIDEKRGTLKVPDISKEEYPGSIFEDGIFHLYDYQFFFRNLQENVAKRLAAYNEKYADRIDVLYNNDILTFDVEPIIENDRTLVPFRAIFEAMGCAVYYSVDENGKQTVSARRANDSLVLTIGENKMYFNGKEIALDVPAKIKDDRTLVPLRAISEAFECVVMWYGDTRDIYIYSESESFEVVSGKLSETITDDNGNILVEAVAYYPELKHPELGYPDSVHIVDIINEEYKLNAENFIAQAKESKADAALMREQMGEAFIPYVFELTYEQTYNIMSQISITNHMYVNMGGAHPTTTMESNTYISSADEALPLSEVIIEEALDVSLSEYVVNLFVEELKEISPETADIFNHDYVLDCIGYLQYYLTKNSVVLYFNSGELAPNALGVISVEIPYSSGVLDVDMKYNSVDEYVYELEYEEGCEWRVIGTLGGNIEVSEETVKYDPETLLSEYYPVGMKKITVKGTAKGRAYILLSLIKVEEGTETYIRSILGNFYVDENNKLTCVHEDDYLMY